MKRFALLLVVVMVLLAAAPVVAQICRVCDAQNNCDQVDVGWWLCWQDKWGICWTEGACPSKLQLAKGDIYF